DQVNTDFAQPLETKVYYYLDDDATPFVSVLPVPPDLATLRDFKRVFTKKGFKYFCKGLDADIK
ncbi:DIX domain protein, partial [Ostertagia ostertagi]